MPPVRRGPKALARNCRASWAFQPLVANTAPQVKPKRAEQAFWKLPVGRPAGWLAATDMDLRAQYVTHLANLAPLVSCSLLLTSARGSAAGLSSQRGPAGVAAGAEA